MSHIYYPDPNADTARGQTPLLINSVTNATPNEVETTTAHGYGTGDQVEVAGSDATGANGIWNITVTSTTKFTLDGSTASGVGTAVGEVRNFTVLPNGTYIDDGDNLDAANLNTPVENIDNAKPFLYQRTGIQRLVNYRLAGTSDNAWAAWSTNAPGIFNTAAWAPVNNGGSVFTGGGGRAIIVQDGDILEFSATMSATPDTNIALAALGLLVQRPGGVYTIVPGSAFYLPTYATATYVPVSMHAAYTVSGLGAGVTEAVDLAIGGYGNAGTPRTVTISGYRAFTLRHWRAN